MTAKGVALVGCLLILAGLVLGLVPVKAGGVSCGSALRGSNEALVSDLTASFLGESGDTVASCDDKRSTYQPIVWTMLAIGAAVLVASGFMGPKTTTPGFPTTQEAVPTPEG